MLGRLRTYPQPVFAQGPFLQHESLLLLVPHSVPALRLHGVKVEAEGLAGKEAACERGFLDCIPVNFKRTHLAALPEGYLHKVVLPSEGIPVFLGNGFAGLVDGLDNFRLRGDSHLNPCKVVRTLVDVKVEIELHAVGLDDMLAVALHLIVKAVLPIEQVGVLREGHPLGDSGGPLQIPPIASEEEWKEENIYTMVHLDRFDNPKTEPIQFEITNLTTQYRSIPAIGEVFSKYSYNGLLQHHRTQDDHLKVDIAGLPLKPINFIQFRVERYDNIYGPKKLSGSNVQIYSVLLVTEICKYVASHCKEGKQLNIGIICPYVAESQMIERLIEQLDSIPENIHFNVGTIHGFQGDECDMVFVVFNPPKAMASQPDKIMLNKKHIINVAISRARDYLFLLIPHKDTEGYANLREINTLGRIVISTCQGEYQFFTSDDIERILFGRTKYLEENTFVTSHQMANVYTEAGVKYEVRIDDNSVDVQISDVEML